jgi:CSLREA domain-containing protein
MEWKKIPPGLIFGCLLFLPPLLASCVPSDSPLPCSTLSVTVTKTADTNDGVCSAADCSLREAVIMTNTCAGQQEIRIPAGVYTLTIPGAGEDAAATGDLDILDYTMLSGIGNPVIDGNLLDRVFHIGPQPAYVTMSDLTIQNGRAPEGAGILNHGNLHLLQNVTVRDNTAVSTGGGASHGGGILTEGYGVLTVSRSLITSNSADQGGGITVVANLMYGDITPGGGIWDSTVSDNTASAGGGGLALEQTVGDDGFIVSRSQVSGNSAGAAGGGIQNFGRLTLYQSTVQDNTSETNGGGVYNSPQGNVTSSESALEGNHAAHGGGLYNEGRVSFTQSLLNGNQAGIEGGAIYGAGSTGQVNLADSTVSGNAAPQGGAAQIVNGKLEIEYSTLAGNTADGIHYGAGTVWLRNSIVAGNGGANCSGFTPQSGGFNIDSGNSCSFSQSSDLSGVNPMLQPLAMNGGLTLTHALDPASPAIDSADPLHCGGTDQRGVTRPQGSGCDRGAYEREAQSAAPTATVSPPALTPTARPTPALPSFLSRSVSTDTVYYYGADCGPTEVTFGVQLNGAENVAAVNLFVRLKEKSSGKLGAWSAGIPMASAGVGKYAATVAAEDVPGVQDLGESWLQYQFVALDASGEVLVRSDVYGDVTALRCGKAGAANR